MSYFGTLLWVAAESCNSVHLVCCINSSVQCHFFFTNLPPQVKQLHCCKMLLHPHSPISMWELLTWAPLVAKAWTVHGNCWHSLALVLQPPSTSWASYSFQQEVFIPEEFIQQEFILEHVTGVLKWGGEEVVLGAFWVMKSYSTGRLFWREASKRRP